MTPENLSSSDFTKLMYFLSYKDYCYYRLKEQKILLLRQQTHSDTDGPFSFKKERQSTFTFQSQPPLLLSSALSLSDISTL